MSYDKIIIHDLDVNYQHLLPDLNDCFIIDANTKAANCIGCFGCWLKTPGVCILKDSFQYLGAVIPQGKELIIITKNCYGGYSPSVKRVMDRSIAASTPFFTYRNRETHHTLRYSTRLKCKVFMYGEISALEKQIASELIAANGINMGWQDFTLTFLDDLRQLQEVWQ